MGHGYKIPKLKKGEKPRKSISEMMKEPEKYNIPIRKEKERKFKCKRCGR